MKQQELGRVRSQPPAGSSSTQQPSNVRLEDIQNDLVQLGTLVNKIRTGFSDDFLSPRTTQGLDKVVEELKEQLNSISRPTPPTIKMLGMKQKKALLRERMKELTST